MKPIRRLTADLNLTAPAVRGEIAAEAATARQSSKTIATAPAGPTMTESEQMFRSWLSAFGNVESSDPYQLRREVAAWTARNITKHEAATIY